MHQPHIVLLIVTKANLPESVSALEFLSEENNVDDIVDVAAYINNKFVYCHYGEHSLSRYLDVVDVVQNTASALNCEYEVLHACPDDIEQYERCTLMANHITAKAA